MVAQETILQNAYETTLSTAVGATGAEVTLTVASAPVGSPSASNPMYLVIDPDSDATREYVKVTSRSGATLTVVRNIDTDSGGLNAHAVGAKVRMVAMKQHFDEIHDRVDTIINSAGTAVVTTGVVKDEDDMVSDSASHLATQQSIKAYVDSQVTAQDLDFTADTTTGTPSIDLDSETLNVAGGTGIDTSASANEITVAIDSTVTTNSGTQTLTNKTIDSEFNTITVDADEATVQNLEVDNLKAGVLDTDLTSVSASDDTLASAKAIKTYVDAQVDTKDTLAELDDVTITTPGEDEVLAYDSGTSQFINQTPSEAGLATSAQGALADSATQPGDGLSTLSNDAGYMTASSTDSLTNKTFNVEATGNSISNIDVADLKAGVLDTDLTAVSATDDTLPSAKATKAYVDSQVSKSVIDALNVDADTLDGNDSTAFATSAQGALADSAVQPTDSVDVLADVDTTTSAPTSGQALLWNGSNWTPGNVASSTAAKIIDADGDTQIQTEESADEDILRFDTAAIERATLSTAFDLTDNGGAFIHSQTQASTYTIATGKGTLFAGPITITGTVTNNGTMVVI